MLLLQEFWNSATSWVPVEDAVSLTLHNVLQFLDLKCPNYARLHTLTVAECALRFSLARDPPLSCRERNDFMFKFMDFFFTNGECVMPLLVSALGWYSGYLYVQLLFLHIAWRPLCHNTTETLIIYEPQVISWQLTIDFTKTRFDQKTDSHHTLHITE